MGVQFFCMYGLDLEFIQVPYGEGNGNHSRILAWKLPGTEEPGGLPSMGSHRVRHD